MLSAIAARKAAQAAKIAVASQQPSSTSKNAAEQEQESESDSEVRIKSVLQPGRSKRKPSEGKSATRKKRRKNTRTEPSQTRYYDIRGEPSQIVETDESSSSSSRDSDGGEQGVQLTGQDLENIIRPEPQRVKRAWSPSRPPPTSSDEDLDLSAPGPSVSRLPFSSSSRIRDSGCQPPLSTLFVPQLEKNVFYSNGLDDGVLSGRKGTVVTLKKDETIALLGIYSLTVLHGTVSLMGSELHACSSKTYTIFAPKCSPIPIIKALPSVGYDSCSLPETITSSFGSFGSDHAILLLEDVHTGAEGLGRVCKTFENVFDAPSLSHGSLSLSTAKLVSTMTRSVQPFHLSDSWNIALDSLSSSAPEKDLQVLDPLVLLVKGQKKSGKSTFARTLVNTLVCRYRRVAYLECDIGQTEFTPPGLVSLNVIDQPIFGPPFTHPRLPYASHFIGASSPRNNPELYLAAISALLQTFKIELQYPALEDGFDDSISDDGRISDVVPLVVNTMGWLKGLGADLARRIEEMVAASHIFLTKSQETVQDEAHTLDQMNLSERNQDKAGNEPRIFEIEAIAASLQPTRYSAADWRTISLLSYFYSTPSPCQYHLLPARYQSVGSASFDHSAPLCTWDCRLPLVAQPPFSVTCAEAIDSIVLVGAGMEDVVPSEIARVLNGAIVGLVSREADLTETDHQSKLPYVQGSLPPDPSTSNCIGLALIRGVSPSLFDDPSQKRTDPDSDGDILHVLTPVPPALISASEARCFVKGEIELPVWGMLDYREFEHGEPRSREIPYLQWSKSDIVGAERRRVRRNIMRRGQM